MTCLVAIISDEPGGALAEAVAADLDASCRLPAAGSGDLPQLVIGTLDINQGALPPDMLRCSCANLRLSRWQGGSTSGYAL